MLQIVPPEYVAEPPTEAVGGGEFTVTLVEFEIQPSLFFAVTLYVPVETPVNEPLVLE